MGKMQSFLGWLSGEDTLGGGSGGKATKSYGGGGRGGRGQQAAQARTRKMMFRLKLQIKRMQMQQRKLDFQSEKDKKKAIEMRRAGDEQRARMYAVEMLKYRKMSANLVSFVTNLQAMQFKLEQVAQTQALASMFTSIDRSLVDIKGNISVPELQSTLESINSSITDLDSSLEVTKDGLELTNQTAAVKVDDKDVEEAMSEIDASLAVEGMELPGAGITPQENEKIKDYKSRIDQLKNQ
jgi:exonuclease VII small subunit